MTGSQSPRPHRSLTRAAAVASTSSRYVAVLGERLARRVEHRDEAHPLPPARAGSSRSSSNARKPRTMFFESSIRSARTMLRRSPIRSARWLPAAAAAALAPTSRSDGAGRDRRSWRTSPGALAVAPLVDAEAEGVHPVVRVESGRGGGERREDVVGDGVREHRQLARRPQNGVCVKWVTARSGRSVCELAGDEVQLESWTSTTSPSAADSATASANDAVDGAVGVPRLVERGVEHAARARRSKRPWKQNQRTWFEITS